MRRKESSKSLGAHILLLGVDETAGSVVALCTAAKPASWWFNMYDCDTCTDTKEVGCDPRVVQARDHLEKTLVPYGPFVHFDAATCETGREEAILGVFTEERHRADLGKTGLDVRDRLELGSSAEDGDGIAVADVLWVEGKVVVRGAERSEAGAHV